MIIIKKYWLKKKTQVVEINLFIWWYSFENEYRICWHKLLWKPMLNVGCLGAFKFEKYLKICFVITLIK